MSSLSIGQIIQYRNDTLLQLLGQEYIQKLNRICYTFSCTAINIFFYKLYGTCIVQHCEQHVDVLDVVLNFPPQRRFDLLH